MDDGIKELIEYTKLTLGLENYNLLTHELHRTVNIFNETTYTLGMEWLPLHLKEMEEDDMNPPGTAVIDIDVHTRQFKSVIFVGGKSYAKGITFQTVTKKDIIKWLEKKTGLVYGRQFLLDKEEEQEFQFAECRDGVKVSPSGSIEIKFDKEGNLISYSLLGHFPSIEKVQKEDFSLTKAKVELIARKQMKLIEFPSEEREQLIPAYGIEEIYVTNDGRSTIPFEFIVERRSYLQIEKPLVWETPIDEPFKGRNIELQEEVSTEQAFSNEPHPDSFPITNTEKEQAIQAVEMLLRQEYQNESEKWVLKTLHRNNDYILATLKHAETNNRIFERKLTIFIDSKKFQAVNYIDNEFLVEMYQHLKQPEETKISRDEAYEKIRPNLELTPVYVYDFEHQNYILCGKIDCRYGVHAASGEVFDLNEL